MSRYELKPRHDVARVTSVVVGWDRPLETFFLQICMRASTSIAVWLGTRPREFTDVDQLLMAAASAGVVPDDLRDKLIADRDADAGVPDGPAQTELKQMLQLLGGAA